MRLPGSLVLAGLGMIKNFRPEVLVNDPETPILGQMWYNSTDGLYKGFDGTAVVTFAFGGNTAAMQTEIDQIETSLGLAADGTFAPNFTATKYLSGVATDLPSLFTALDTATGEAATGVSDLGDDLGVLRQSVGASTDFTLEAFSGTGYLDGVSSLRAASLALDTATGNVAATAAQNATDVAARVLRAGDTMVGNLAFNGAFKVTGLASPSAATDAATKAYVDSVAAGLDFQADVLGVQVDATLVPTLTAGARYILTDPGVLSAGFGTIAGVQANDIVEYDGEGFVVVYDVSVKGQGALAWNRAATSFVFFDGITWTAFGGLNALNAGVGLAKDGNTLHVNMGAGIAQLPTDEVGLDLYTAGGLMLTEDGVAASESNAARLAIKLDGSSLAVSSNGLTVASQGVEAGHLAASVAGDGLTGGAGVALAVGAGTGISVTADAVALDLTYLDGAYARLDGAAFTGSVTVQAPVSASDAAPKSYVDAVQAAVAKSAYLYDSGVTSAATHTITHNLGNRYCNVTIYDAADKVILPDAITAQDDNTLVVEFSTAITCKVVCSTVAAFGQAQV